MSSAESKPSIDIEGNNLDSVTPIAPPIEAAPRLSNVLRAGLVTGITASLVCWSLYGIATLFGTEFDVAQAGNDELTHVAWYQILILPFISALIFAAIAAGLRRRRHCRRTTLIIGYTFGLLSLVPVLAQPADVTWPTKIWLSLFHLITMAIVVPQVARVVGDSDPFITAGYRRTGLDAQ